MRFLMLYQTSREAYNIECNKTTVRPLYIKLSPTTLHGSKLTRVAPVRIAGDITVDSVPLTI